MQRTEKTALVLGVALLAVAARAWQPDGWVYHNSPNAYSMDEGRWYYLDDNTSMWTFRYDTVSWHPLRTLSPSWVYFTWPNGFVLRDGGWYWLNESDVKWCFCYQTGQWSRLGERTGMVLIPAGSFQMGDNLGDGYSDELPVHAVYVSAFYMDKYEVTNDKMVDVLNWAYGQGKLTVSASTVRNAEGNSQELLDLDDSDCRIQWNGSQFVMKSAKGSGYPCVKVTWYGAVAYCNYRTLKEGGGRTPCYSFSDWSCNWSANGYRLPTEAEWEKAARGGLSGQRFPWGAEIQHSRANYYSSSFYSYDTSPTRGCHPDYDDGGYPYTSPVGAFAANGYGLYDMAGNVWEWCWDWYGSSYYGSSPGSDPRGPVSGWDRLDRVGRGGSWHDYAYGCRVASRSYVYPPFGCNCGGFRAVLPPGQ